MAFDTLGPDQLHFVSSKEFLQRLDGMVGKVFVVNRIEKGLLVNINQIGNFEYKNPVRCQKVPARLRVSIRRRIIKMPRMAPKITPAEIFENVITTKNISTSTHPRPTAISPVPVT